MFFTKKLCNEYANYINENVELDEQIEIRCKNELKNGICFKYLGDNDMYKNYKSCNPDTENIVYVDDSSLVCKNTIINLFIYLQNAIRNENNIDYVVYYKNKKFAGILITQLNECDINKPNNIYSVKLICTQKVGQKPIGMALLGIYVYILKKKKEKLGLLELAKGFSNNVGFCLYDKLNFKVAPEFDCAAFETQDNINNVKMVIDMSTIEIKKLIQSIRNNSWYDISSQNKVCSYKCSDTDCLKKQIMDLVNYQDQYEKKIPEIKKRIAGYKSWNKKNLFGHFISKIKLSPTKKVAVKKLSPTKKITAVKKSPTKKITAVKKINPTKKITDIKKNKSKKNKSGRKK